jgi:predicted acyltransferase
MFLHAIFRSVILISLGIFLRSLDNDHTDFTFDDTLTQIGLGYTFLFLIAWLPTALQYACLAVVLVGYWGIFAAYPIPGPDFDYAAVSVPADWEFHRQGFESHWNKNSNAAWAFDTYWMNLFPRENVFVAAGGGYATLSFIPTLGTMLLGLFAGTWLRTIQSNGTRIGMFILAIAVCAGIAIGVDYMDWCPIVKRIWTPTWTLYSGAWCFSFLLLFHLICDLWGITLWSFPLRVIGANSIAAYVMSWTLVDWLKENWFRHFGWAIASLSESAQNFVVGGLTFVLIWGILYWMYRRGIFLRI